MQLLRHSLDGYAYMPLDDDERRRWEAAYETDEEGAFCRLFGPEKIPAHLGEFLGYFMVRKVIAGQGLLKAAGTVTGKLVRWLADRGDIDRDSAADASERARDAAHDLPLADRLGMLLHDVTDRAPDIDRPRPARRRGLGRGLPRDHERRARQALVRGRRRAIQRATKGKRPRPPRLVDVRDRSQGRGTLASA